MIARIQTRLLSAAPGLRCAVTAYTAPTPLVDSAPLLGRDCDCQGAGDVKGQSGHGLRGGVCAWGW